MKIHKNILNQKMHKKELIIKNYSKNISFKTNQLNQNKHNMILK